jgi:hypothetical protein
VTIAVVSGALANKPGNGGAAWTRLSYVLGLRRLGFDTYFIEQIAPDHCVDGAGAATSFEQSVNRHYFGHAVGACGLTGSATLVSDRGDHVVGTPFSQLLDVADGADLLINISGHLTLEPLLGRFRRRVYVDLDPGFTQLWSAQGIAGPRLAGHDAYFTVGTNIGQPGCSIPAGDIQWIPTLPPTVLSKWPFEDPVEPGRFTTVASWRGPFGPVSHGGHSYGLKVHEFRKFAELPKRAAGTFELALDIHPADGADRDLLLRHGWRVVDPASAVAGPLDFRRYVQGSSAEFSAAQGIYVDTRSGWFSDRTARYLASGKPAIVQDTGLGQTLPVGEGLLTFRTLDEAVERVHEVMEDPERHRKAARALAEEHLDSDLVLGKMLEYVGVAP